MSADRAVAGADPHAAATGSPPALLLAAHHGAVDVGLLALPGATLGGPVRTETAGLGQRPAARSFPQTVLRR